MRGAWIEIGIEEFERWFATSLPMRGAWIEMPDWATVGRGILSLPMRGAWIEMPKYHQQRQAPHVAPHAGSVD